MSNTGNGQRPAFRWMDGFQMLPYYVTEESYRSALSYKAGPGDIFLVTYPKAGTTWTQYILWELLHKAAPIPETVNEMITEYIPYIEITGAEGVKQYPTPRVIKTHLPWSLVPKSTEAKYVVVLRNPKDVCVSYYHHAKMFQGKLFENGTFADFYEAFMIGEVGYGDCFQYSLDWYNQKHRPNVLVITFEEMKKNARESILKMAKFLGGECLETAQNEEMLQTIIENTSFSNMQKKVTYRVAKEEDLHYPNPKDADFIERSQPTNFIRKGLAGEGKITMTEAQNTEINKKMEDTFKNTDLWDIWKEFS